MRILPLLLLLACVAWQAAARAQEEGEARPASRGLLKRGLLAKGKQTTTTTTAAPQEEAEYADDVEYADGEGQEASTEAPASSTEGKKLVAGGVRPFRSNTDLLEALKRRRAQAAEAKLHGHASAPVASQAAQETPVEPAPAKSSYTTVKVKSRSKLKPTVQSNDRENISTKPGRRRNIELARDTSEKKTETSELAPAARNNVRNRWQRTTKLVEQTTSNTPESSRVERIGKKRFNNSPKESVKEEEPAPVKPSRGRFGRPASRSIQEDHEEQNESAPAPARTSRAFSRRGN